jgi:hypothetical protein
MPSYCIICGRWFEAKPCCKICDESQVCNKLCGNCSGVGPYSGRYTLKPQAYEVAAIQHMIDARALQRKEEKEKKKQEKPVQKHNPLL